jgi:hypothetical protein
VTEIKFIQMLLEEIFPEIDSKPATLLEDNTGCLYLIENKAVGSRTKHINIKMHHIREMTGGDDPRLRVVFVPSELNFADPMTKNVSEAIFQSLVPALKNGCIADSDIIYDIVNREDVGKRGRTYDTKVPIVGTTEVLPSHNSESEPRDSEDGPWIRVDRGKRLRHGTSQRIAYNNGLCGMAK